MWLAGRDLNPQLLILENSALPLSYRLLNRSSTRRFGYCRGIVPRSSCETLAGRPGCAQSSQRAGSQGSDAGQCVITLSESPDLATRCYLVAGFHAAAKYERGQTTLLLNGPEGWSRITALDTVPTRGRSARNIEGPVLLVSGLSLSRGGAISGRPHMGFIPLSAHQPAHSLDSVRCGQQRQPIA